MLRKPIFLSLLISILFVTFCANLKAQEDQIPPSPTPTNSTPSSTNSSANNYTNLAPIVISILALILSATAAYQTRRNAKANANAGVLNLFHTYMSLDYHEKVRKPAWYALHKARQDEAYRKKLLKGIAGVTSTLDAQDVLRYDRRRKGTNDSIDEEYWLLHNDYHRVLDMLGFFTTLSLLEADNNVVRICNFFYDSWRSALYRIIRDLEIHLGTLVDSDPARIKLRQRRLNTYQKALEDLDKLFDLPQIDQKTDSFFLP